MRILELLLCGTTNLARSIQHITHV
jgi:hypothetical protein